MGQNLFNFDGRIVVVTGAAGGGIGTSVTRMLAEVGATVVAVSRSQEKIDKHIAPLIAKGLSIVPVVADVSTDEGVAATIEQVRRTKGTLYGLANIAGGAAGSTWMRATRVTRSDWRALFNQNLETMFFMSQAVAAELKEKQPSRFDRLGLLDQRHEYGALPPRLWRSEGGDCCGDTHVGRRTGARQHPRQCHRPGHDDDARRRAPTSMTIRNATVKAIAMGRRAQPEEQAGAILFFLSDLSSYITGQTVLVDGGLNLKWTHLGADNTSLFLKDESFRAAIKR